MTIVRVDSFVRLVQESTALEALSLEMPAEQLLVSCSGSQNRGTSGKKWNSNSRRATAIVREGKLGTSLFAGPLPSETLSLSLSRGVMSDG